MTLPPQVAFAIPFLRFLPNFHMFGPVLTAAPGHRYAALRRLSHFTAVLPRWMLRGQI